MNPFPFSPDYFRYCTRGDESMWQKPYYRMRIASVLGETFPLRLMGSDFAKKIDSESFLKTLVNSGSCMSFAGPVKLYEYMSWDKESYESIIGEDGAGTEVWCVKLSSPSFAKDVAMVDSVTASRFGHIGVPVVVSQNETEPHTSVAAIRTLLALDLLTTIVSEWLRILDLQEVLTVRVAIDPCPLFVDYTCDALCAKTKTHPVEVGELEKYIRDAHLLAKWMKETHLE